MRHDLTVKASWGVAAGLLFVAACCVGGCAQQVHAVDDDADVRDGLDAQPDSATDALIPVDASSDVTGGVTKDSVDSDALASFPSGCPPDPLPEWAPPLTTPSPIAPPPGRQCALPGWPGPIAAKPLVFVPAADALLLPANTTVDHCLVWQDLDGDGLEDLTFLLAPGTPTGGRKLVIARGQTNGTLKMEIYPTTLMAEPFDCAVADLKHDGNRELLVTTLPGVMVLGLNGANIGSDVTKKFLPGTYPFAWAVTVFDLDGDGAHDVYLSTNQNFGIVGKYVCANADAPYVMCCLDVASAACMQSHEGTSAVANCCLGAPLPSPHVILHNQSGALVDVSAAYSLDSGAGMTVSAHDLDRDGRVDLFVGNDFGHLGWYLNRGNTLPFVAQGIGMRPYAHTMGSVAGDFDGDQRDDLLVTDWGAATLYHATAQGFADASSAWGVWPHTQDTVNWAPLAEDWDRDGHLDYAMTVSAVVKPGKLGLVESGDSTIFLPGYHLVGQNVGGQFLNTPLPWPDGLISEMGAMVAAAGDYDHDGDLDLFLSYGQGRLGVWRNDTPQGNHWLTVHAVDSAGPVIGALVQVWAQGHVQEQHIAAATGWGAKRAPVARFGLGSVEKIELVRVWWPTGKITDLVAPTLDQDITVQKP